MLASSDDEFLPSKPAILVARDRVILSAAKNDTVTRYQDCRFWS
ncbi:MAG TPA: hypothetical protein VFA09_02975 [Ktedonobacteraceae bacterium]|nr:hypothetical protein [Ktedonobacteraceae bacterium]